MSVFDVSAILVKQLQGGTALAWIYLVQKLSQWDDLIEPKLMGFKDEQPYLQVALVNQAARGSTCVPASTVDTHGLGY